MRLYISKLQTETRTNFVTGQLTPEKKAVLEAEKTDPGRARHDPDLPV